MDSSTKKEAGVIATQLMASPSPKQNRWPKLGALGAACRLFFSVLGRCGLGLATITGGSANLTECFLRFLQSQKPFKNGGGSSVSHAVFNNHRVPRFVPAAGGRLAAGGAQ
jgi:hypothetical protein